MVLPSRSDKNSMQCLYVGSVLVILNDDIDEYMCIHISKHVKFAFLDPLELDG